MRATLEWFPLSMSAPRGLMWLLPQETEGKMRDDPEARLMRLAARQYSVFTRGQVLSVGLSDEVIRNKVSRRLWLRLHRGVFMPASVPVGWQQKVMAAVLACGRSGVASHASAEIIWGFTDSVHVPEVTVRHSTTRSRSGVVVHRTLHIERVWRRGFPVTPPMRTLLDLSDDRPEEVIERYLDAAHRRRLIAIRPFEDYLTDPRRNARPGAKLLRTLLALRDPDRPIGSDLETIFFRLLRRHGLPLPIKQLPVRTRNGEKRIDFAYPEQHLAIEVDGYEEHGTRLAFETDRARQNELEELGYGFRRFTWNQVRSEDASVAVTVGLALGLRPVRWKARLTPDAQGSAFAPVSSTMPRT